MGSSSSKLEITKRKSSGNQDDEFIEDVVCKVQDLKENELKKVDLSEEYKVLLVKQNGIISALGTKCTHYGAPLENSALGDGRIRCQWHGACFNVATGDIEDFPGLDSLPCYQVTIENDNVKVKAKKSELVANKRVKNMAKKNLSGCVEKMVVVGGGPAGAVCVETLRQDGFQGDIVLVCKENYLPYDRPKATKDLNFNIEKTQFRDDKFYKDNGIEVLKGVEAISVNTCENAVKLSNGQELRYTKLFLATGSKPRRLDVPGGDLKDVVTIRGYDDTQYAHKQLKPESEVVILGSSFIAMEIANYCLGKVKTVTVVSRGVPFQSIWGERIGSTILKLFEDKGLKHIAKSGIKKINDNGNGAVSSVELSDGQVLKCDVLFLGIGVTFCTEFLKDSGIQIMSDGAVEVNEYMQTNVANVYAGGDIAYAPVWSHNTKAAIGHFGLAHYHGKKAAVNMLGKQDPLKNVPYFWTMLFGKGFRYAGYGKYDDIIYHGNVEEFKFIAFFLKGNEVISVISCGMDPLVSQFAERLAQGKKLYRKDLQDDPLAWSK